MNLVLPLPYAYSTSPAIFRLKLPYKLTLEGTLHSTIKDITTDNLIVINFFFQILRVDWSVNVHHDATILFKTIVLVMSYAEFLRILLQMVCWLYMIDTHIPTLHQVHAIHTYISYCFTFEVSDLHISWLWELQSLATHATIEAIPLNQ